MEGAVAEPQDGRQRIPSRSSFEEETGFTRALRVGDQIFVSGTVGTEAGGALAVDAGRQADRCFELIKGNLEELGGHMGDVVRVRMFVTDIADADAVSAAFTRALKPTRPCGTLVAIAALYQPEMKVEIEADAVIGSGQ
jgi:enamine deaminase RidA (YjgF/YER057c/UK114 family)